MNRGELVGLGVGPGDPELLTLAAVATLRTCHRIFAAASTRGEASIALGIAKPHLPAKVPVERLNFPMTTERKVLQQAWEANAQIVRQAVDAGERCVFLTLGDPLLYSTFGYLLRTLLALDPDFPVRVIPGITAFQAAAARLRTPLAEGNQRLLVLPGSQGVEAIPEALAASESVIILKAGRRFPAICAALQKSGAATRAQVASQVGLPGEELLPHLPPDPAPRPYLTLVLVTAAHRILPHTEEDPA